MPFARLKKLNTKDCLWIYILRILQDEPMHAYHIRKEIHSRYTFQPGVMTAYKVLYLLHKKGFVSQTQEGRKRVYTITPKGKKELERAATFYKTLARTLS